MKTTKRFLLGMVLLGVSSTLNAQVYAPGFVTQSTNPYVGIGTTNPTTHLTVKGVYGQYGTGLSGGVYDKFVLYCDQTNGLLFDAPRSGNDPIDARLPISFQWRGESVPALYINPQKRIAINSNSPKAMLDIRDGDIILSGNAASGGNAFVIHHQYWLAQGGLKIAPAQSSTGAMVGDGWVFMYNGEFRSYGKIYAPEIEVMLPPFPDYVFESKYKLMSLAELENYIGKNKHLPGIPSAEEIKEKGIGVGALQAKLMEKIEELTLYMIDLNKKNEQLEQQLAELKKAQR